MDHFSSTPPRISCSFSQSLSKMVHFAAQRKPGLVIVLFLGACAEDIQPKKKRKETFGFPRPAQALETHTSLHAFAYNSFQTVMNEQVARRLVSCFKKLRGQFGVANRA